MGLIEVDALKEKLDKIPARSIENTDGRAYVLIRLSTVLEIIKQLPSVQPEIIKCKDCRFYEFKQGSLPWNNSRRYCNRSVSLSTQENDYCSYAELREE